MNILAIKARSIARRVGLTRLYHKLFPRRRYEEKLHNAILASLKTGDVIWDIGANQGIYSKIFCEKTGPSGHVFAFEPTPESCATLSRQTAEFSWVHIERKALSDFDGAGALSVSGYDKSNHLVQANGDDSQSSVVSVPVVRGDTFWKASGMTPNVVKIDVEGFEEEGLAGMDSLLAAPGLRAVFVEVHFRLLEDRGRSEAPVRLENLLRSKGLRPRWVDPSHIAAERSII
jgi:FkbM family methyltransferase